MRFELDHFFILTDQPEQAGDLLVAFGLQESFRRDHKGQGTSNRRFEFANGMLEILYLRDVEEARNGPAKEMCLAERVAQPEASPFGVVLTRTSGSESVRPFKGWSYQADYFPAPNAFHVGDNSNRLHEPLCVYVPFMAPVERSIDANPLRTLAEVTLLVPAQAFSDTLDSLSSVDRLSVERGDEHLVEMTLGEGVCGKWKDFRPQLPLKIHW